MKLNLLHEDKAYRRIEQAMLKYLGVDFVRALKKLNRGSNIKPSGERKPRAYGFGGAEGAPDLVMAAWNRDPDLISFIQGVKPIWSCDHYKCEEIKSLPEITKLHKEGKIGWKTFNFRTVFFWSEFGPIANKAENISDKMIAMRNALPKKEMFGSKRHAIQAVLNYVLGMAYGYNEDEVLRHVTSFTGNIDDVINQINLLPRTDAQE